MEYTMSVFKWCKANTVNILRRGSFKRRIYSYRVEINSLLTVFNFVRKRLKEEIVGERGSIYLYTHTSSSSWETESNKTPKNAGEFNG